jgi:tetratricopeptide (TPR) repeat protein
VVANAAAAGFGDHACRLAEGLVDYLVRQGRYQECRAALELVLPVVDRTGGPMAAALRNALGTVDNLQGRYEQARGWLREALWLARRSGDLHNEALARCGLGVAASYLGLSVTAAAHLGALSELARRLDDDWLRGNAAYNLGRLDHQLGEPERALERFQEAVVLAGHSGDQRMAVFALLSRSDVHADLGRYAQARAVLHGAVAQAGELGDRPVRAFGLTRLGSVEQRLGSVDAAIELHRRALTEVTEQTSVELETETRVRLGNSYLAADRAAEAHRQFSLVLPLTRAGTPKGWQARAHRRALDGLRRSGVA